MMNLSELHLDAINRHITSFIKEVTGLDLQVVDQPDSWKLVLGINQPIEFGYNKFRRGNLSEKKLKYMTYVSMLQGIQSLLTTPDKFVEWRQKEKAIKN